MTFRHASARHGPRNGGVRSWRGWLRERYYNGFLLNALRHSWHILLVRAQSCFFPSRPVMLHLGCGRQRLSGFVNIDWRKTSATDRVLDIRRLPYRRSSVVRIETYHVIEHLPLHDVERCVRHWFDLLVPGGTLIIECPDFDQVCRAYLNSDHPDEPLYWIFGRQRFPGDTHLFGYNLPRLTALLARAGFTAIRPAAPQDYHRLEEPCLRVECAKPC